ncbi:DUF1684 domain-containing protein [Streptomyces sp. NBC_01387]|uniref:DUF1684 domain-containing protein n=1 Tax=unclassified Streptomyces TaxID=2593676 RepID=UPI0020249AF3|nr:MULTISPECIES: DUF1684 domain-containing protein [unclassified Streptomyces]WSC23332.1 DUF1684 domain-containing protein [Streptomyces sp. NBC_01766]WSV57243.1 DUF1684 domain-containing protein [Streptomyces sp. NBC_01014]
MTTRTGSTGGADSTGGAGDDWENWHEGRTETVSAPYGPLALTGTHWLDDAPEGLIPAVAGHWRATDEGVVLTATAEDGLTLDGKPFTGRVTLRADHTPAEDARLAQGERRLVVVRREGLWAVRVWDPGSANRRAFAGIEATPYDADWVLPGLYRPYGESRTVRVPNADGRDRGLGLAGELAFHLAGDEHTLQVAQEEDGSLWAVFADATSGTSSYRFRFLRPSAPAADGGVTVDFNRALLPPCAFAEHFICPFPPPGNTLPIAVDAGERAARTR